MRTVAAVAIVMLAGVVLARPAAAGDAHDLSGAVLTFYSQTPGPQILGDKCGSATFIDFPVKAGDRVTVRDEKGKTIAVSTLRSGTVVKRSYLGWCRFPFKVKDLEPAKFYRFRVPGVPTYEFSRRELTSSRWKVELRIDRELS